MNLTILMAIPMLLAHAAVAYAFGVTTLAYACLCLFAIPMQDHLRFMLDMLSMLCHCL